MAYKKFTDLPLKRQQAFNPPKAARWNLFGMDAAQKAFVKSENAAAAKTPTPKAAAKPVQKVSLAKSHTPRPIPADKKKKRATVGEKSILGG